MAVYHVAEKLRLAAEAAARADPERPARKPYADWEERPPTEGRPRGTPPRELRVRRTGQAMFGGWRFEKT